MNKKIFLIALIFAIGVFGFSQERVDFKRLYNNFSQEKNVEKIKVSGLLMFVAKPFMYKHVKGGNVSSVQVLSLDDCPRDVKERFNTLAENFNDPQYELFIKSNEPLEKTRVFTRFEKNTIRELVIITMGKEPSLVRVKGKLRPDDVQNMINRGNNGKQ